MLPQGTCRSYEKLRRYLSHGCEHTAASSNPLREQAAPMKILARPKMAPEVTTRVAAGLRERGPPFVVRVGFEGVLLVLDVVLRTF